ncbi:MAG: GTP cyclohydrolase I FolE, partial [Ectothiorhodospiraceae bacterium]
MNDDELARHFEAIIAGVGEDSSREGLARTPQRAARAFRYLTHGYDLDLHALVNNALFASDSDEMVVVRNIEFYSLCEHHLLPVIGRAHVGYLPNGRVLGLSKIARVVDMFARRLQLQEQLTQEIAEAVREVTNAHGVGVQITANHLCMRMRGVEKQNSEMRTSVMLGAF